MGPGAPDRLQHHTAARSGRRAGAPATAPSCAAGVRPRPHSRGHQRGARARARRRGAPDRARPGPAGGRVAARRAAPPFGPLSRRRRASGFAGRYPRPMAGTGVARPAQQEDELRGRPDDAKSARRRRDARPLLTELGWGFGTATVATVIAAIILRLWDATPRIPLRFPSNDALIYLATVKGLIENGWVGEVARLGAPFGSHQEDFPAFYGDTFHFALMWLLARASSDPVAIFNAFYLLTYPLTAAAAYFALRGLEIRRPAAALCGVLFALLPFHFFRGQSHLTLSAYYGVPVACWLILTTIQGRA